MIRGILSKYPLIYLKPIPFRSYALFGLIPDSCLPESMSYFMMEKEKLTSGEMHKYSDRKKVE
jgi:hypothetical protein